MPIIRQRFLQLTWSVSDLDSVCEFWSRHYSSTRRSPAAFGLVELTVSGASDSEIPALVSRLERMVGKLDPGGEVRRDPEAVVASALIPLEDERREGLWPGLLKDLPASGLSVNVKWRVGQTENGTRRQLAIVVVGQLEDGQLIVKAVWVTRDLGDDATYMNASFEHEDLLVGAFDRYVRDGILNDRIAEWFARPPAGVRIDQRLKELAARLWQVPPGAPRLKGILLRFPFMVGLLAAEFALLAYTPQLPFKQLVGLGLCLGGLACLYFVGNFANQEWRFLVSYWGLRAQAIKSYWKDPGFRIGDPERSEMLLRDPAVRRHTRNLLDAGFRLAGDITASSWPGVYRNFLAPDGITYLVLICWAEISDGDVQFRSWPASVSFQAQTFFTNGGRVDSLASKQFLRGPQEPSTLIRSVSQARALEFLEAHRLAAEEFASEEGLTPCRHESLAKFLERQQQIFEVEAEHDRRRRYSLRDHLRWYLQLPYAEFRTPA